MKSFIRDIAKSPVSSMRSIREIEDLILYQQSKELQLAHPNPLNKYGQKCFSQTDEDGITLEILRRISATDSGVYAEFGVGDGTENNTLILAALGWKGFWVGGEDLKFEIRNATAKTFTHLKEWVTVENAVELASKGLREIGADGIDVLSLDLDGNDLYILEALIDHHFRPKLFIIEYNAKFPPPVEFQIAYDPSHVWNKDDYFGASLTTFVKMFGKRGYQLVCCNSHSGANAFFIESALSKFFLDVPTDIRDIYVAPRYHLYNSYGHPQSLKTLEKILGGR